MANIASTSFRKALQRTPIGSICEWRANQVQIVLNHCDSSSTTDLQHPMRFSFKFFVTLKISRNPFPDMELGFSVIEDLISIRLPKNTVHHHPSLISIENQYASSMGSRPWGRRAQSSNAVSHIFSVQDGERGIGIESLRVLFLESN